MMGTKEQKVVKIKSKNSMRVTLVSLIIIFAVFTVCILSYIFNMQKIYLSDSKEYIGELASQSVVSLKSGIEKNLSSVRKLGEYISATEGIDEDGIIHILNGSEFGENFLCAGFIDADGKGYTTRDEKLNFSEDENFIKSINGEEYISNPHQDVKSGILVSTYSAPVYDNDKIIGVIFASYDVELYEQALNFNWFNGQGNNFIADKSGLVLASSKISKVNGVTFDEFMQVPEGSDVDEANAAKKMRRDMEANASGFEEYVVGGIRSYVCYTPIGVKDWYMFASVPVTAVENKTASMMLYTVCICTAVILLFLIVLAVIFKLQSKGRADLEKMAFVDELTGKNNYNWFLHKAKKIFSEKDKKKYAVATFDIDKFKYVNDVYGYETGNETLKQIAATLEKNLNDGEISVRMQSDCYVMLLEYNEQKELMSRLNDLCEIIHRVGDVDDKHYDLIVAMGVYEVVDNSMDVQAMVDRAVIAKKTVKGLHRSTYAFYDDKIRSEIINEKRMESEMNTALEEGQFEVYYQPKYFLENLQLSGAEALVRWNRPQKGIVPPNEFIDLFEKNGFIIKIDLYVFTQVCMKLREWMDKGVKIVPISVNLSRKHIANPICVNSFFDIMRQYDIPPKYVEFELTESTIFEGGSSLLRLLDNIHDIGCAFSMDDFGTGYSSLNMLKDIPVDVLKLDREFLNTSVGNTRGREIIESIVALAKKLGIKVVAEGVEEEEQLEFLKGIGCDIAQGFYLSKPIKVEEFEKILFEQNMM